MVVLTAPNMKETEEYQKVDRVTLFVGNKVTVSLSFKVSEPIVVG